MRIKDLIPWANRHEEQPQEADREHPVLDLQREMNRLFDDFWGRPDRLFGGFPGMPGSTAAASDVVETDEAVEVSIELPGLDEKDLDVALTEDSLTIKGEKKVERQEDKKGFYLSERTYGAVHRSIPLPPGIDVEQAEARFRNGVLTVTLPKSAEAASRLKRIEIKAA